MFVWRWSLRKTEAMIGYLRKSGEIENASFCQRFASVLTGIERTRFLGRINTESE